MDILKSILQAADKLARKEIRKYGSPERFHYEIANAKGLEIAAKLKANQDIVSIGTRLMDVKIGQAIKEGRLEMHVEMSSDHARKFLSKYKVPKEQKAKIINCIEAHHKGVPFTCKEAEVCANADCYRMLTFEGALTLLTALIKRGFESKEALAYLEKKIDEKWGILSLGLCKKELAHNYKLLKSLVG